MSASAASQTVVAAADGSRRFGRYHFVPDAGEAFLSPDDGSKRSANFLVGGRWSPTPTGQPGSDCCET